MRKPDDEAVGRSLVDYSTLELRAIATRALVEDDDSRSLLRQQLEAEEFSERGNGSPDELGSYEFGGDSLKR